MDLLLKPLHWGDTTVLNHKNASDIISLRLGGEWYGSVSILISIWLPGFSNGIICFLFTDIHLPLIILKNI